MKHEPGFEFMLTPEERYVAQSTGNTRQLAKAAQTWLQLARELGLTMSDTEARLASVRQMDPQTAKKFRKGARTLLRTLEGAPAMDGTVEAGGLADQAVAELSPPVFEGYLGISDMPTKAVDGEDAANIESAPRASGIGVLLTASDDGEPTLTIAPEEPHPAIQLPEIVTPKGITEQVLAEQGDQQPIEPPVNGVEVDDDLIKSLSISMLDVIGDNESAKAMVRRIVAQMGVGNQLGDIAQKRREDLLDNLGIQHGSGQGADDALIDEIMSRYIENAKTVMSSRVINGACFWGHLNGVDMAELVRLRQVTMSSAKAQDVQNARQAVVLAYKKVLQSARKDPLQQSAGQGQDAPYDPDILADIAEVIVPEELVPAEEEVKNAHRLEDEPSHVQLGNRVVKLLDMPDDLLPAAVEVFNPKARAGLTNNKEIVLDQLRRVVLLKDIATGFNGLEALADSGKYSQSVGPVRRLLGIFNQNNKLILKELHTTAELVAKLAPWQQSERADIIYEGMTGLLDIIEQRMQKGDISLRDEDEETVKQVAIDDGGIAVLR